VRARKGVRAQPTWRWLQPTKFEFVINLGNGECTPYAAIQAQRFHTPGYTETGLIPNGFALNFDSRHATDTRSELGARFDRVLAVYSNAVLALRGRVAWAHDWISDPTLTPLFQALPGAPRNPMVGTFPACCARAMSGHAAAAPPSSVMNSRRLTRSPRRRGQGAEVVP
jgi:hypothetical protein